ncbi:MAG: PTS sugar transporter subunit IIC [Corallococcus sp.]|nr:PTS sugar transporter subunit IIC [Corallococcus sp.]
MKDKTNTPPSKQSTAENDNAPNTADRKAQVKAIVLRFLNNVFVVGLGGMAQGLFATLIVGTIICQIASYIPGDVGYYLNSIGTFAKILMGAGIGFAVSRKFDASALVGVSASVAGMIGAYAGKIISHGVFNGSETLLAGVGEPLGAYVASYFSVFLGKLVSGKTKVDILVTPLVCVLGGGVIGLLLGSPISFVMNVIGQVINSGVEQQPIIMGMVVSALMGIALTLPISSAAIGMSLGLGGIAAGAATVGCCCQMVGFAVMSFKENRWGGLVSQGIGTSMLQMPNIVKHPQIWAPPIIASIILGPISAAVFNMQSNAVGSGMGTAGLVGPIMTFTTMIDGGVAWWIVLLEVICMYFVLPAAICFGLCFAMRKLGWIKDGWLKI